jgi:sulfur-carrier protein
MTLGCLVFAPLAHVGSEVPIEIEERSRSEECWTRSLSEKAARYPMLRGAIRERDTHQRRPFLRFFACEEDLSHNPPDAPFPDAVASGR